MENHAPIPTTQDVVRVLETIIDPELGIDLWTLGLIYDIDIGDEQINIRMTFTSIGCPAGAYLVREVRERTLEIPGIRRVDVEVVFDPPWEIPEDLKASLGLY